MTADATESDQGLVSAVQRGDSQAYQRLYERYIGMVYSLCFRLCGERGLAEDACQEVFVQLWRKVGNYRGDSKFSTWLHSVASNVTISYLRKQRSWMQRMFDIEQSSAMDRPAEASMETSELDQYVRRLPERARMVFVLHAIEGYRHEDIADMMDMAVGSSKAQFHRAKHLIQEWMGYA